MIHQHKLEVRLFGKVRHFTDNEIFMAKLIINLLASNFDFASLLSFRVVILSASLA